MKKSLFIATLLCLPLLAEATVPAVNYKNQAGSSLTLNFKEDGSLSGTFSTEIASRACQQYVGQARPIAGFYAGTTLSFTVSFPACGSTVAFIGTFSQNKDLDTLWLVAGGMDGHAIGHDTFKRVPFSSNSHSPANLFRELKHYFRNS